MLCNMSEPLDIGALRALQAVKKCGGVTAAAEALCLSQSAVSHKIRRLEGALDCTLLSRRAGAPLLTETGERLLRYAERIISLQEEALASLGVRPLKGTIRFGVTEDITSSGLAAILGRFARLYPNVNVRSSVAQSLTHAAAVDAGGLDLAVIEVFAREVRSKDRVIREDKLVWAAAPDFVPVPGRPWPFLAFDDNCFYRRWAFSQDEPDAGLTTVMDCASIEGVVAATRAGLGVSLLNERHVPGDLAVLDHEALPHPPAVAHVLRRAGRLRSEAVDALAAEIVAELK